MKTVIVTGASGQDGSYLCEFLDEKGYQVVKFRGDITNYHEIYETIKQCNPDEIYNLAAKIHYDSPIKTFHVNTMGIINIIEAVKSFGTQSKCKIFQASSSEIFANTKSTWSTPQTIHTMRGPRGIYGISKESADSLVRHYRETEGIFVCSGILYNHESPRRPVTYVTQKIIRGLQSGKCFQIGNLESRRDWGHAKDYVKAMWLMLQQKWAMDFIIASGKTYSVREFIELAVKKMNKTIEWSGEGVNEVGIIDGETAVKVSCEFYQPNNNVLLTGNNDPIEKLGWTREYDIESLIEEMLSPQKEK
jgi:GDPmannose 4,6-dehydratase|tara:strand:- start:1140 stop:2054 length:915 start_codon:yes stop_codon:yes gene_type:complete